MRLLLSLLAIVTLGACTGRMTVTDHSVERVSRSEVSRYVGEYRGRQLSSTSSKDFVLVSIAVNRDLVRLAQKRSFIFESILRFCDEPSGDYHLGVAGLVLEGRSLLEWSAAEIRRSISVPESDAGKKRYDILLYSNLERNEYAREFMPDSVHLAHDLRKIDRDICIRVLGGHPGARILSNEFRVQSEEISAVLN